MGRKRKAKRNAGANGLSKLLMEFGAQQRHGEPKMSEVLVDIAMPLLKNLPDENDREGYTGALNTAAALWNARLVPGEAGADLIISGLKKVFGQPVPPEFDALFRAVLDRAELFYPGLDRMISRVEVVPKGGGGYTVTVASIG
jgi:hypothetical protein